MRDINARAGVIPVLASSDRWEALVLRPGRDPIAALASLLAPLSARGVAATTADHAALVTRLRAEPGHLGMILRARAHQKTERILLFVDQFEEPYTLGASEEDRRAFAACLAAVADDSATPLRVVLSLRSDFLDRVAESDRLVAEVTRGLVFLAPVDRAGLRDVLVQPLELAGYRFESPSIVEDMLAARSRYSNRNREKARELLNDRGAEAPDGPVKTVKSAPDPDGVPLEP